MSQEPNFVPPEPGCPPQYVQAVHVDGQPLAASHLDSRDLRTVDHIRLELGPTPSGWGRDHRPPSASTRNRSASLP